MNQSLHPDSMRLMTTMDKTCKLRMNTKSSASVQSTNMYNVDGNVEKACEWIPLVVIKSEKEKDFDEE